jgi:superfamily I DNA and/or RNA helicase
MYSKKNFFLIFLKNFPLLWHSVSTTIEKRDEENKSYQNENECNIVYNYVNKLILEANVKPKDIGIITPYRFQVFFFFNS